MYALVARRPDYEEGYWDFWTYPTAKEAHADWADDNEKYGWEYKVINLNFPSPEANFVNEQLALAAQDELAAQSS